LTTSLDEKLSDAGKQSSIDYQKLIQRMNTLSNQMSQLHQQKDHQLKNFRPLATDTCFIVSHLKH